jgi:hypothetical protein
MSKKQINITDNVMSQIREGQVKMRPRVYFILGSLLVLAGLTASVVTSVFLVSLTRFALRAHGPMGQYRLEQLISSFPWWAPIFAGVGLAIGIWLLRQYDFSYKRNFWIVIVGFIMAILIAGWVIDMTGLDEVWLRQGPMRGIMRHYFEERNIQPEQGNRRWMNNP